LPELPVDSDELRDVRTVVRGDLPVLRDDLPEVRDDLPVLRDDRAKSIRPHVKDARVRHPGAGLRPIHI